MQQFTRPLTREIELAGERLAVTFSAAGISVRPVGSRKLPIEMSWAEFIRALTHSVSQPTNPPTPEESASAIALLKKSAASKPTAEATTSKEAPSAERKSPPASDMKALLARLERWLAVHRPDFYKGLLPGARLEELEALQNKLGVPLPESLKALLAWHNGQSADTIARFEQHWALMSTAQIAEAKSELDANALEDKTGWQPAWIPLLDNDAGDYVCLDTSEASAPVREFWLDRTEHPIVAASLEAWLAERIDAMERGQYHQDPERGTFERG
jgi:cell wall assembly regulator SMI1